MVELSQTYADVLNKNPNTDKLSEVARLSKAPVKEQSVSEKLSSDVTSIPLEYVSRRDGNDRERSTYIPVTLEETSTGFKKTYYDTYTSSYSRDRSRKKVYVTLEEYYDKNGQLVRTKDFKVADGSVYLRREKEYTPEGVRTIFQESKASFLGTNKTTNQTTNKQFLVTTPEGKKYLIANTPEAKEWAKKRFGVDVEKQGITAIDENNKTYYGQKETFNGKDFFVGVRSISAEEQKANVQLTSLPQGAAVSQTNTQSVNPNPRPSSFNSPTLSSNILIPSPTKGYSVMPEGTTTRETFTGFIPFEQLQSELTIVEKPSSSALGEDFMLRADMARERGDLSATGSLFALGAGYKVAGGVKNTIVGTYKDPLGTAATVGAFALSTYALGPAGAGLTNWGAAGATFAGATAVEVGTGQKPTVLRAVEDPFTVTGEALPFVAAGFGYKVVKPAIGAYNAKVTSFLDTRRFQGEIITRDVAGELALPPGKELSRQIQVKPLESINRVLVEREQGGASVKVGVNKPVFGEPVFLTAEELANQPTDFMVTADVQQRSTLRQASANPNKLFGDVSSSSVSVGRDFKSSGLVSASDIQAASQNIVRVDVASSNLPANLVRESVNQARATFEGIDLSGETALVAKKTATQKPVTPKALDNLPGSIDQWSEQANVKGPGGEASLVESFATGEKRVFSKPLVVEKVVNTQKSSLINLNPSNKIIPTTKRPETEVITPSSGLVSITVPAEPVKVITILDDEIVPKKETVLETKKEPLKTNTVVDNRFKNPSFDRVTSVNNRPDLQNKLRLFSVSRVGYSLSRATNVFPTQKTGSVTDQKVRTDQVIKPGLDLQITPISTIQPVTATDTAVRTQTRQIPISAITSISTTRPPKIKDPEKKTNPFFFKNRQRQTGNFSFDVFVRQRGKFKAISRNVGSLEQAFRIGRSKVEKTSAASFRIRTSQGGFVSNAELVPSNIYTKSKKDSTIFVQKASQRMSNTEERLNIKRGALWGM